jgi:hypothetical protein
VEDAKLVPIHNIPSKPYRPEHPAAVRRLNPL